MKRTIFHLALALAVALVSLPVMAQNDVGLTMQFRNEPLVSVFNRLEASSPYKFLFTYEDVADRRVNFKVSNSTVFEILDYALRGTGLGYGVDGKFISVTKRRVATDGQKPAKERMQTVGGYVLEKETRQPVIGAQVKVVGTNVVTVTDLNGAFHFDYYLSPSCEVEFSYVGMKTRRERIAKDMKVFLEDETHELSGVVVTGIFKKSRESYTGSVSTIDKEQLRQFRGQNLLQTLKNVDASLNFSIDNVNGSNPNNLPNLSIRGSSSLPMSVEEFNAGESSNPNTPLIIMDGFEITLTKLMDYNDEEIESINILKDAAATAIYGSRGANGVIVVVSRQPEPGRLRVSLDAGVTLEVPDLSSYHLLNAAQKLELEKKVGLYDRAWSMGSSSTNDDILYKWAYNKRLRDVLSGVDTDWLSKPLHTGVGQRYNLRLEGGSKEFRWGVDAQYRDTQGAMKGSDRKNFTGAITLLYKYSTLTFRNYTSVGITNSKESPYGSFGDYVSLQPYDSPYDADGNVRKFFDPFMSIYTPAENPLYNASLGGFDKSDYQELTNNFSIDWNILPELTLRGQFGISRNISESHFFRSPDNTYYESSSASAYQSGDGFLRKGYYRYGNGKTMSLNADATLAYNKVLRELHSLYVGLSWSLRQSDYDSFYSAYEGISNEDMANIANFRQYSETEMPSGSNTKNHQFGVTANVNYTYNSKYYADFSYRIDGNSSYGSDKKYASFYSAGVGWNLHNERFLKEAKPVDMLRLKASYGETGAASGALETDAYTYYNYITDNRYMSWMGAQLGGFGNPNLSWQVTKEINVGTEFALFDHRLNGSFEYYVKNTDNLLSSMDLPHSMGFSSYRANIGEVENKGWEAALRGYVIRDNSRKFFWLLGGQLVYNKNKIKKLSQAIKDQTDAYMKAAQSTSGTDRDTGSGIQYLFYEGYPQNAIYAVRSLGIDPSTGKEIFLDRDGNITDVWKESDKVYCGSADPLYRGNVNTTFTWGNFTLNASFGYYWGGKAYNSTLCDRVEVTLNEIRSGNVDERVLSDRWFQAGDVSFYQKFSNNKAKATSRYVMDNNVLELQSVSLQYKLSNAWLNKYFRLQSAIFSVNMNDLFHWGSIRMERGTSYPYARNIQGSVKLLF